MKLRNLAFISVGIILCGCTSDIEENASYPAGKSIMTVRAAIGDDSTRTTVSQTDEGTVKTVFDVEAGDCIGICFADAARYNLPFTADSYDSTGEYAIFKYAGEDTFAPSIGDKVYGYYPYQADNADTDLTAHTFTIERMQTQAKAGDISHIARYYPLAAKPTTVVDDGEGNATADMSFAGMAAMIRFRIVNGTDRELSIGSVIIEKEGLTGVFTADLTSDPSFSNDDFKTTPAAEGTDDWFGIAFTEAVNLSEGESAYAYAVVDAAAMDTFTFRVLTADGLAFESVKELAGSVQLSRSRMDTFRLDINDEGKWIAVSSQPEQDDEGNYLISNANELAWIAEHPTEANSYKLTADIDLTGIEYYPIGYSTNYPGGAEDDFVGTFDGNEHKISNITITPERCTCVGLFGATGSGAVIKNLTVENVKYAGGPTSNEVKWVGGLIGYARPDTTVEDVTISNVDLSVETTNWSYRFGGVIGLMEHGSEEISHYKNISVDNVSLTCGYGIGGFAGTVQQNAVVENCKVSNISIYHKNQSSWKEEYPDYYPETGGYVYASSFYFGDANGSHTVEVIGTDLISGNNSRTDLDQRGLMNKTTWDLQPYVGEFSGATIKLNGEELSRKVTVSSQEELIETLLARGGEVEITQSMDFSSMGDMYLPINYPTVITLDEGVVITEAYNQIRNYSDLTICGTGTIQGDRGLIYNVGGDLTVNGCTLKTTNAQIGSGIYSSGGTILIEDCDIEAAFYALYTENTDITINGGSFKSTSYNKNGNWAYCISIAGQGSKSVINDAVVEGIQGGLAVIDGAEMTINGGTFSTYYPEDGTDNVNYYALYIANGAYVSVYDGKFYSEGPRVCVCSSDNDVSGNEYGKPYLYGGYYEDMGYNKETSTTLSPAEGYRFVELEQPLVEGRNTYYYKIEKE